MCKYPPELPLNLPAASLLRTSTRLAVSVGLHNSVRVILSTEVVVLLGTDTLGEHCAGQDAWSVFGQVSLLGIDVVVAMKYISTLLRRYEWNIDLRVDEYTTLDLVTRGETIVDRVGKGVGHV
jgi:hypothetical protein